MEKRYIIKKYIIAKSAKDAINKDKSTEVDEIYCDIDYKPIDIGFKTK